MSEVRRSTGVKANILELCRCSEQRSDGWWETNYDRVIWTNRIWASALRSTPLRTEWWSVQRPDDTSPCRQTPASNNTITQMLLILYPSVILHFHHFSCSVFPVPRPFFLPPLSHSSFLSFSSLCCLSRQWLLNYWWDVELVRFLLLRTCLLVWVCVAFSFCCHTVSVCECVCVCVCAGVSFRHFWRRSNRLYCVHASV